MTNASSTETPPRGILAGWFLLGVFLIVLSGTLAANSYRFGYAFEVIDMPVFWLAGGLAVAGLFFLVLLKLIPASLQLSKGNTTRLVWLILALGLCMRLAMFASEPALEDDYQRYLWDGAVTAHGLNPYAVLPDAAKEAEPALSTLGRLAVESGQVLDRVNHPHLRTVYPPVTQGVFALSHLVGPWSLTAWRGMILLFDLATVGLILFLLREISRSPLWAALYWWNPIVIKELFNSAHMEAVMLPLMLAGLAFATRKKFLPATAMITLAAGAKIWPAILLPLIWRPLASDLPKLAMNVAFAAAGAALFAWPILAASLDSTSGLVAYASRWKTNSALFPLIEMATNPLIARAIVAATLAGIVIWLIRAVPQDTEDFLWRAFVLTAALFLLAPAQFPWYLLWVLPLLCLFPVKGLLVLSATLPVYYSAFYFLARGTYETFSQGIVWAIWIPAWALLLWQGYNTISRGAEFKERPAT